MTAISARPTFKSLGIDLGFRLGFRLRFREGVSGGWVD